MLKLVLSVVLASAFVSVVLAAESNGPEVGLISPNLIGRTLSDKSYRLKNDLGKPKVINFFWVKCEPCRLEMPELAQLEKQYPNVKFISVHTSAKNENPEEVVKFVNSLSGAPSNIVLTSGGVQETFHYFALPHTIIMDSNNVVIKNFSGYTPANMKALSKALQNLAK